jgi:putative RecB family exonuclease
MVMVEPEPARIRRSVSQLTSYASCAESHRLQKIAKAPQRPAGWYALGRAAHQAIEDYENSGRQLTTAEAVEVFHVAYDAEIARDLIKWPDWDSWMTGGRKGAEADVTDRRVIGAYQVEDYIRYAEENAANWRIVASEVEFTIDLGGVDVLGYIDQVAQRIDGTIQVRDLKGGSTIPGSAFQLAVYGLAAEEYMGVKPDSACFVKLGRPATARGKAKPTVELEHDLSLWSREQIERMFRDFDKAERLGIFLPNPSDRCETRCGVADFCTVPGKGFGPSAAKFAHIKTREDYFASQEEVAA